MNYLKRALAPIKQPETTLGAGFMRPEIGVATTCRCSWWQSQRPLLSLSHFPSDPKESSMRRLIINLVLVVAALIGINALSERASHQVEVAGNAIHNITSRN